VLESRDSRRSSWRRRDVGVDGDVRVGARVEEGRFLTNSGSHGFLEVAFLVSVGVG